MVTPLLVFVILAIWFMMCLLIVTATSCKGRYGRETEPGKGEALAHTSSIPRRPIIYSNDFHRQEAHNVMGML